MNSWPTKKLGELTEISSGGTPRTGVSEYWNGNIPWLRSGELIDEVIYDTEKKISERGLKESSAKLFPKNSILIALTGATVGKTGILKIDSSTNQSVAAILPNEKYFIPEFVWYFLRLNYSIIKARAYGGAQPHIDQGDIKAIKIPLPPLEIQQKIVGRLDKIAEAQKLNDELIQKADELFQSLLHKEFDSTGKNWEVKKLSEIGDIVTGTTPSTKNADYWNGEFLWATPTDITNNVVVLTDTARKLSKVGYEKTRPVPKNAILVTCIASIGKMALASEEMATNQQINSIVCNEESDPFFIFFSLQKNKKKLIRLGKTTAVPIINKSEFGRMKILLPPPKIQKQIVEKLSAVQEYKKKLLDQKQKLQELFESVLNKTFQHS